MPYESFDRRIKIAPSILSADFANLGAECRAIEAEEGPRLVIGVQWHPEYLLLSRRDARLFKALAAHA